MRQFIYPIIMIQMCDYGPGQCSLKGAKFGFLIIIIKKVQYWKLRKKIQKI